MLVLVVTMVLIPTSNVSAATTVTVKYNQTDARKMAAKINEFRTGPDSEKWCWDEYDGRKIYVKNLAPLQYDANLEKIAMVRAAEMAKDCNDPNFFVHHNSFGVYSDYLGESRLMVGGPVDLGSIFTVFKESNMPYRAQYTRRCMLSPQINAVGIGVAEINGEAYWVIEFAQLAKITPAGTAQNTTQTVSVPYNDRVPFTYTGVKNLSGIWTYIRNGKIDLTYTGVAKNTFGWWRVVNGKVDFRCNSVEKNEYGWWVIRNGKVDFSYNGLAANSNGTWYCKGGKVDFSANGVLNTPQGWYLIKGGKVQKGTVTVAKNQNGWWYINKDGKVDFTYTGLATNNNGTWYIRDGKVDFTYNGKVTGEGNKVYIVVNGKVQV